MTRTLAPILAFAISCGSDIAHVADDESAPPDVALDTAESPEDVGSSDTVADPFDLVDGEASDEDQGELTDGPLLDADLASADVAVDSTPDGDMGLDVSECPVETMNVLYSGILPPNPYATFPEASACVSQTHDVVIVLGCPNRDDGTPASCQTRRADMAVALASAGLGTRFITSGAAVSNAYVEAETLRDLLIARGISSEHIWLEPRAEHTDENIYFSTRIMEEQGWATALVVSDDPGHLMMTALCDSNCCVELGRLTLVAVDTGASTLGVGHYVRYPWAPDVSEAECTQIEFPSKLMCLNADSRRACADDFQLSE